ncbi:hypothetical protein LTR29_016055 [Friedmanniomyces endolithicus]|nr:hypothetical protein LTR29_016055 [Friedmanniomyces endolithicus]
MLHDINFQRESFAQDDFCSYLHLDVRLTFNLSSIASGNKAAQAKQLKASVYKLLNEQLPSADHNVKLPTQLRSILPARSVKATNSSINRATPALPTVPVQQNLAERLSESADDTGQPVPAKRPRNKRNGTSISVSHHPDDTRLAQKICAAISEAATRIGKHGVPSWWSDLEELKPKGVSFQALDEALERHTGEAIVNVGELDQSCVEYDAGLLSRSTMTWFVRCFLEIIRQVYHRRSRAASRLHQQDKANRQQRLRFGELLIAMTIPLHKKYGKKAYTVHALLAG